MFELALPPQLVSGDSWSWTFDSPEYPAPEWIATTYVENKDAAFAVAGVPVGTAHEFTVGASITETYKAGRYRWHVRAVNSAGVAKTVSSGDVDVLVNPAAAGLTDTRTWARRTLDAVEAFLEGNASTAQQATAIQGRSITRWPLDQLLDWRDRLRAEVAQEEQAEQAGAGRNFKVRYGRP